MTDATYQDDSFWGPEGPRPIVIRPLQKLVAPDDGTAASAPDIAPPAPNPVQQLAQGNVQVPPSRGILDQLLGLNGPRYQTWPERMVRSGATLPGDVMSGQEPTTDPTTGHTSDALIQRVQDLAGLIGSGSLPAAALGKEAGTLGMAGGKAIQPDTAAPVFHSAVEHALANAPQDKASADQWQGWLKNQPGVKQEELDWLGLPTGKQSVTKADMLAHAEGHGPQIQEVEHNTNTPIDEDGSMMEQPGDVRYPDYQLPGGDNYRELLLTMPDRKIEHDPSTWTAQKNNGQKDWSVFDDKGQLVNSKQILASGSNDAIRQAADHVAKGEGAVHTGYGIPAEERYHSSHWNEPNVLVHMRMNDRTFPQGPTEPPLKSLHLEEVQSDWHQAGRKNGHKSGSRTGRTIDEIDADMDALHPQLDAWEKATGKDALRDAWPPEIKQRYDTLQTERNQAQALRDGGVPDAPFKSTWADLALKRAIAKAAREGYDAISWTPGEQQAERYDISKHVDKLDLIPHETIVDGGKVNYRIRASKDGKQVLEKYAKDENEVADVVGKDVAKKLFDNRNNRGSSTLSGQDLKIGGEGMKKFYDKMLVDKANAIGKKFGAKVEQKELPQTHDASNNRPFQDRSRALQVVNHGGEIYAFGPRSGGEHHIASQEELEQFENDFSGPYQYVLGDRQPPLKVPVLRLTPKLKDAALRKGMPLFSHGSPFMFTPVDGNPFENKQNAASQ